MSAVNGSEEQRARTLRIMGASALGDVLIGLGLLLYGRQEDAPGIVIAGIAVGVAGLLIGSWVLIARDRPERR